MGRVLLPVLALGQVDCDARALHLSAWQQMGQHEYTRQRHAAVQE